MRYVKFEVEKILDKSGLGESAISTYLTHQTLSSRHISPKYVMWAAH